MGQAGFTPGVAVGRPAGASPAPPTPLGPVVCGACQWLALLWLQLSPGADAGVAGPARHCRVSVDHRDWQP